ncbi:hypothetical protein J4558_07055 [Leptolyngbya sp. 15MV]|nr:hypothetical protein J4558_07055 [Leptolyngbya sp. 15MV]
MLSDRNLIGPMRDLIRKERVTAEYAVWRTFQDWAARFQAMKDSAFTTKANDLEDLAGRVLKQLIGEHKTRLNELHHEAVVVATDLTPSQTAGFDRDKVVAFATDLGGRTSHTSIVARALGIPAVVGCGDLTRVATDGTPVIVDAVEVELLGNIEFPQEVPTVLQCGGVGVGLYRTEFLYLTQEEEPTEQEHYEAYSQCVRLCGGRPLVIRTMDLGADKYTQRQAENPERNPFLGLRSIRYCLKSLPMFKAQLRAILRASALGPIKIMFPLVTSVPELRQAKWVLREVMEDLFEEGVAFDPKVPIGMMVEVPSAALMADTFAREVDFFSIGTNDLVQYTLAVDRTNERVAALFAPTHPAVVKLIKDVARVGRRRSVPVSCCGEAAGDPDYALLLLGLGLRTLSTSAASIPQLKRLVRSVTMVQCERIARRALSFDSDVSVAAFLRDQARKIIPEAFDGRASEG